MLQVQVRLCSNCRAAPPHLLRAVALHGRLHGLKLHEAADVARAAQQLQLLEALQMQGMQASTCQHPAGTAGT